MKKVLVVSAHPDDEILGAGGTLLKHKAIGDCIAWIIVTHIFEHQGFGKEKILERENEIKTVAKRLGIETIYQFNFPTMNLHSGNLGDIIGKTSKAFQEFQPEIIYTLNRSDAHSDHRIIFDAVAACTKSFRYPFIKKVLMYECISETEFAPALPEKVFIPNYFIDISAHLKEKIELMKIYKSEMGEHPFPRSEENIRALATFRGATAGVQFAEAFQLLKFIEK